MLPTKLTLENFMSYRGRHAPINLKGLGVACLAGENGAGKSSLFDSITWVLWGRSRIGIAADPLVSSGAKEVGVDLDFSVGDSEYKVIRRHRKPSLKSKSGVTTLDLEVSDGERFRSMTQSSIRETQKQIIKLVGLDYETFINTSYFAQGRADIFSKKTPTERKQLLGEILGLDSYDEIGQAARAQAREKEIESRVVEARTELLDTQIAVKSDLEKNLEFNLSKIKQSKDSIVEVSRESQSLTKQIDFLKDIQHQATTSAQKILQLEKEQEDNRNLIENLNAEVKEAEDFLRRKKEINNGYMKLVGVRGMLQSLGSKARELTKLDERKRYLETIILDKKRVLEDKIVGLEAEINIIDAHLVDEEYLNINIDKNTDALGLFEEELDSNEKLFKQSFEIVIEIESMRVSVASLAKEEKDIQNKILVMGTDLTGECPVCSTPLESHELEKVQQHYKSRKTQISLEIKEMSTKGKEMVADKEKSDLILNEERDRLTREIKRTEDLLSRLRGEKERLEIAKVKSKDARLELVDLIRERDKQVILEQKELNELESDIKLLDYDIDGHETLIIESDELSHYEKEFQELNNLEKSLEYKIDRHNEMSDKIKSLNSNLLAEKENITILDKKLENLIPFQGELKTSDRKYRELNDELIDNQRVIDTLEYQLKELNKLEKETGLLRAKKDKLFLEKIVYEDLAVAFGVKGVQALLVETAVPQLEKDTNELLGKITDNRMSVKLATQRQTKAGERTETLDILIGDEWGTRPYEMYSGGENFRIDFAIRIALSKLLARRSGMRIPLLFIDEGFGSQDQNGKNTLSAAINSLRIYPEFKDGLILVITHLEDVKNQFDNRIEIEKTSNGSEFSVIS